MHIWKEELACTPSLLLFGTDKNAQITKNVIFTPQKMNFKLVFAEAMKELGDWFILNISQDVCCTKPNYLFQTNISKGNKNLIWCVWSQWQFVSFLSFILANLFPFLSHFWQTCRCKSWYGRKYLIQTMNLRQHSHIKFLASKHWENIK